jgi:DNA-binding XRE family transcriptional regulator
MSYFKTVFVTHRWLNTMNDNKPLLPIPVRRALLQLGEDIRNARRRRRIQTQLMAERASINRMTLYRIERGDPRVAMGSYATVLFVLGMLDRLSQVAAATQDQVGLDLEDEILPKRIRNPRPPRSPSTPQP